MRDITLVTGPPCAGKTTWVAQHAAPGDLVVDWDHLAIQAGSTVAHDHATHHRAAATTRRTELEQHVATMTDGRAFVVRTAARPAERTAIAHRLDAHLEIIDPGVTTCLARAAADSRHPDVDAAILRWYGLQWGARCYDPTPRAPKGRGPRHTYEWRTVRKIVLRGQPPCAFCGQPMLYGVPFNKAHPHPLYPTVDHIKPVADGGAWYDLANLQPAHWKCNTEGQSEKGGRLASAPAPTHRTSEDW